MARYAVEANRTASTTLSCLGITADATRPRRGKIFDIMFGSEATPADNVFLWQVHRCSDAGTSTGVTPLPLDPADAATEADAGENHTVEGTVATGSLLSIPLNQRATYRWVAAPGSELVYPATASNGFRITTPTATAVAITATALFEEQ